jgi:hypothetical protein
MKIIQALAFPDDVVVDSNPEMADLSNPSGLIYGGVIRVQAETKFGRRFIHERVFDQDEVAVAETLVEKIMEKGEIDLVHWIETDPAYGSFAWEDGEDTRRYLLAVALATGQDPELFS